MRSRPCRLVSISLNKRIEGTRVADTGNVIAGFIQLIDQPGIRFGVAGAFDGTSYIITWTDQRNYPFPAQPRDDVFTARVAVNGTVLDPGGRAGR